VPGGEGPKPRHLAIEKRIGRDDQCANSLAYQRSERRIKFSRGTGAHDLESPTDSASGRFDSAAL
jgi:hypothetical protein